MTKAIELVGYKRLVIVEEGNKKYYISPSQDTIWWNDVDGYPYLESLAAPAKDNHDGIYTLKNPNAKELNDYSGSIVMCLLYGAVVEGESGYRSQGAKVIEVLSSEADDTPSAKANQYKMLATKLWDARIDLNIIPLLLQHAEEFAKQHTEQCRSSVDSIIPHPVRSTLLVAQLLDKCGWKQVKINQTLKELKEKLSHEDFKREIHAVLAGTRGNINSILTAVKEPWIIDVMIEVGHPGTVAWWCIKNKIHDHRIMLYLSGESGYYNGDRHNWMMMWPEDAVELILLTKKHRAVARKASKLKPRDLANLNHMHRIALNCQWLDANGFGEEAAIIRKNAGITY